jgi:hypothetical protein
MFRPVWIISIVLLSIFVFIWGKQNFLSSSVFIDRNSIELRPSISLESFLHKIRKRESLKTELLINGVGYIYQVKLVSSTADVPFKNGSEKYPPLHFQAVSKAVPDQFRDFSIKPVYDNEYFESNSNYLAPRIADIVLREFEVPHYKYFWAKFKWGEHYSEIILGKSYDDGSKNFSKTTTNIYSPEENINTIKLEMDKLETFIELMKTTDNLIYLILLADTDSFFSVSNFYVANTLNSKRSLVLTDLDFSFSSCELVQTKEERQGRNSGYYFRSLLDGEFDQRYNSSELLNKLFSKQMMVKKFEMIVMSSVEREEHLLREMCGKYSQRRICKHNEIKKHREAIEKAVTCSKKLLDRIVFSLIDKNL